jgi:hypothetical protein
LRVTNGADKATRMTMGETGGWHTRVSPLSEKKTNVDDVR